MKLRNRLKELRARDGLNQTELAKLAGVSRQTISLLERGEYTPSIVIAFKIAIFSTKMLRMSFGWWRKKNEEAIEIHFNRN